MTATNANIVQQYQGSAPKRIVDAVASAAKRTGADFKFLMEKASAESSFNPAAKAKTSSATGLFQFIESTWLNMVKDYGHKFGLGKYADQITKDAQGRPCVEDCDAKKEILALRKNPEISALMAGVYSAQNKNYLQNNTNVDIGETEMYLAHFMGAGAATKFINARVEDGDQNAAKMFPAAAHANRAVFYDHGHARTLDQVYAFFDNKFNNGKTVSPPSDTTASPAVARFADAPRTAAPSSVPPTLIAAEALTSSQVRQIKWDMADDGVPNSGFQRLSNDMLLAMIDMQKPSLTQEWRLNS